MIVQPGLCGTWSETSKNGFLITRLISELMLLQPTSKRKKAEPDGAEKKNKEIPKSEENMSPDKKTEENSDQEEDRKERKKKKSKKEVCFLI